jgi:DNA polymerase-1
VLLLDTLSLFFRAFYALPPMTTAAGEPTGALYGFSVLLLKLLREHQPRGLCFALDGPEETERKKSFPEYKAGRPRPPSDLVRQLRRLPALLEATGAPARACAGHEADDVLATLAHPLRSADELAIVVSGDTDLLQLARGSIRVLFVGRRGKDHVLYDAARVVERYGVTATQLPSLRALLGDKSDNLPAVPGIGERTASRLVAAHGDAAGILAHVEGEPRKVRAALEAHREQILRSEALARLRDDLPVADVTYAPLDDAARVRLEAHFAELEFKSLLPRLAALFEHGRP